MLQTELKVVAVGKPDLEALTDGEKRTFLESIFSTTPTNANRKQKRNLT